MRWRAGSTCGSSTAVPGIPPARRDDVFQPFQRLTDHGTGVGLGLAVARGFTRAMGGELALEDTPGGGTTAVVSLPQAAGRDERGHAGVTRVLVVDDEAPMLRTLSANLRARGFDVDLAPTGEKALALAARRHPDVVVLDLGLPGIDGIEVIRGLRGWSRVPDHRPVGSRGRARQGRGARRRRRRLRGQAVRHGRAAGPRAGRRPPGDSSRRGGGRETDDFTIDLGAKTISARSGDAIKLTPTEWQLLEALVRHRGRLVSHPPAPPGGVGPRLRRGEQLPAGPHGPSAGQAGAAAVAAPLPADRARHGLPVRRRALSAYYHVGLTLG